MTGRRRRPTGTPTADEVERGLDATPSSPTCSTTTGRPATYDEKWSISFDERCIDYARDRFVAVAGDRRLAVRPRRSSSAAAPASSCSTSSRPACSTRRTSPTCRPAWSRRRSATRAALGFDVDGRVADAERMPVRRRHVRPRRRARRAAPHPRRRARAARGAAGAQAGRPVRLRRRADAGRRLVRPPARPAHLVGHHHGDASCRRCASGGAGRRRSSTSRRGPRRWRRSSTCTRSTRDELARHRAAGRRGRRTHDDRGADRGVVRLAGAHLRGRREPGATRLGLGDVRLPVVAAAVRGRPRCWPTSCRSGCSTTCCSPGPARREAARQPTTRGRSRCGGSSRPRACAGWCAHRAFTPYYLVRYWRFLRLRLRHPARGDRGVRVPRPRRGGRRPARLRPARPRPVGAPR